jgi:hypothetical protein
MVEQLKKLNKRKDRIMTTDDINASDSCKQTTCNKVYSKPEIGTNPSFIMYELRLAELAYLISIHNNKSRLPKIKEWLAEIQFIISNDLLNPDKFRD